MTQIYIEQNIHKHQTQNFRRISPFGITPVEKAHKARTFTNRYVVEWTSKAEIRPEEQSEKAESCRENLWNKLQLKGP